MWVRVDMRKTPYYDEIDEQVMQVQEKIDKLKHRKQRFETLDEELAGVDSVGAASVDIIEYDDKDVIEINARLQVTNLNETEDVVQMELWESQSLNYEQYDSDTDGDHGYFEIELEGHL